MAAHVNMMHENVINNGNLPCFESPDRERVPLDTFRDLLVISYENQVLDDVFGIDDKSRNIFILRDAFNYFASRLRHREIGSWPTKPAVHLWKSYAKEALNDSSGRVFVNFNKWFLDQEYRKELCDKIGVEFNDDGINQVPKNGGGSSFGKVDAYDDDRKTKLLTRWKDFLEDDGHKGKRSERYKKIFEDNELIELSNRIFGEIADPTTFR